MTRRRSWRDLDDAPAQPAALSVPSALQSRPQGPQDLEQAAALAPNSRLSSLLEERRQLEDRLKNLTGLPGQGPSGDARRDAMFHVPSFAERQAEARQWEHQRQRQNEQQDAQWGSAIGRQMGQVWGQGERDPATGLGATGLSDGIISNVGTRFRDGFDDSIGTQIGAEPPSEPDAPRERAPRTPEMPGVSDRVRALRNDFTTRSRTAREALLARPRAVAETIDRVGRPLRQIGDQLANNDQQLDEMDRKLAAEGVSQKERDEIRSAVKSDAIDKVSGIMGKANKAIEAPKKAVAKVEQFWMRKEQQISGPMDRFSGYAADRERRLSTETGGSGDLFERMQANRMSALRRRQQSRMQERADERRRERARERAAERRAEES